MNARDYFPLGLAEGKAFCNRSNETLELLANIKNIKHSLLVAARKYGKSSLALHAIQKSKLPYIEIDFFLASNETAVEKFLLNGITTLIGKSLGPIEQLISSIKNYVKVLQPRIAIGELLKLELITDPNSDPATNVKEALLLLDQLLKEKNKYAILWLDEFQNVGVIAQGTGIEASIRHAAQKTKNLIFIFSGSNRRMLLTMFEDDARPLYKLCWKIAVNRMGAEHYIPHLQQAAQLAWKRDLELEVIQQILALTELHPFYVNKPCDQIWFYCADNIPTITNVKKIWDKLVREEKSDAVKEISNLSLNQKAVLCYLAHNSNTPNCALTSKETISTLNLASSSILAALQGLEDKDIIEPIEHGYRIINPVIKYYAQ